MLAAMREPWNMDKTLLFNRIPAQATQPEQMIPVILSAMEKEPLLQNSSEFQELITEYGMGLTGKMIVSGVIVNIVTGIILVYGISRRTKSMIM